MRNKSKPFFWISSTLDAAELKKGLDAASDAACKSVIVLCASSSGVDEERFNQVLAQASFPVFGGVFPQVLYQSQRYQDSVLIVGFDCELQCLTFEGINASIKDPHVAFIDELPSLIKDYRNFLLLVDGLSASNESFIHQVYERVGSGNRFLGGGAGYMDFQHRPCLFTNEGFVLDAALLIALPWDMSLGVSHGWEILSGPFIATDVDGCRLKGLNYLPALDYYCSELLEQGHSCVQGSDFFSVASRFPLGIQGINGEIQVRDPIDRDGSDLLCVGEILPNSMLYLLKGNPSSLIESVGEAMRDAGDVGECTLVFDCISRVMFLGDAIEQEVSAINQFVGINDTAFGVFSLGEIITGKSGAINWLNKSTSVGRFSVAHGDSL